MWRPCEWLRVKVISHAGNTTRNFANRRNISENEGQQISIYLSQVDQRQTTDELPDNTASRNEDDLLKRLPKLNLIELNDDETQIHRTLNSSK